MATAGKIMISIEGEHAKFVASAKAATKEMDGIGSKAKEISEQLKSSFGRGSGVEEFTKILKGAGAVAGLAEGASILDEMSKKAAELSTQFRQGKINGGEVALSLAEGLPIIGSLIDATKNFAGAITGTAAQEAKVKAEIELGTKMMAMQADEARTLEAAMEGFASQTRSAEEQLALLHAGSSAAKLQIEIQFNWQEGLSKAFSEMTAKTNELRANYQKQRDAVDASTIGQGEKEKSFSEINAAENSDLQALTKTYWDQVDAVNTLHIAKQDEADAQDGIGAAVEDMIKQTDEAAKTSERLTSGLDEQIEKLKDQIAGVTDQKPLLDALFSGSAENIAAVASKLDQVDALTKQWEAQKKAVEDVKKAQEELAEDAKRRTEDAMTPLEKYNAEMKKLKEELDANLISQQTYDREAQKLAEAGDKKSHDKGDKGSAAQVRRFDFAGPKDSTKLETTADKQLESQKKTEFYNQQIWNIQRNAQQQNAQTVIDF